MDPGSGAPAASRCILVVDDQPDVREALATLLRLWGHSVLEASGGEMALLVAQHGRPDVVLLDLRLPDMDGYEVARRLRAAPDGGHPFVIAMTGFSRGDVFDQLRASGFDEHLLKPYELEQLEQVLAAVPPRVLGGKAV